MTDAQDPGTLREGIEQTRHELGDTVEALAAKTDVKSHAKRRLSRARSSLAVPATLAAGGAVVGVVVWRVRKRRAKARTNGPVRVRDAGAAALRRAAAAVAS